MTLIKRLEMMESKATPGPWYADTGDSYSPVRSDSGPICDCDVVEYDTEQGKLNSMLIADMRNALPKLLDLYKAAGNAWDKGTHGSDCRDECVCGMDDLCHALAALESLTM